MLAALGREDARQICMAAQLGIYYEHPLEAIKDAGLIQLDGMSIVAPSHRLALLVRTRDFTHAQIDDAIWDTPKPQVFETYTHAACLLPLTSWPLFRQARRSAMRHLESADKAIVSNVLDKIEKSSSGLTIGELEDRSSKSKGWNWSEVKSIVQYLIWSGRLVTVRRTRGKRVFALTESTLPTELLSTALSRDEQLAGLARKAVDCLAIVTASDLAFHYNLSHADAQRALQISELDSARVDDWTEPAYLSASIDKLLEKTVEPLLIGPFDNLMRDRQRLARIFGLQYKLEAYVPAAKRLYGPYAMALFTSSGCLGLVDIRRRGTSFERPRYFPKQDVSPSSFAQSADDACSRLIERF